MSCQTEDAGAELVYSSCGGRGWKFVQSRVAVALRAVDEAGAYLPRRVCRDCDGTGAAAAVASGGDWSLTGATRRATSVERREHLDALTRTLDGFDREISLSGAGVPILVVTNPDVPVLSDHVLCCHDTDGALVYLWPWGKRIAKVSHLDKAAYAVRNMLSCHKP